MRGVIDESVTGERLQTLVLSFFAVAALLLSTLGVYGVVAYAVRQRTTEIGTRMAIGATTRDVLRLVLKDGLQLAGIGVGLGLVLVFASAHLLRTSELHVEVTGIAPFLAAISSVAGLTLIASWYPAWRASSLTPLAAIRDESVPTWKQARSGYRGSLPAFPRSSAVRH